jgi:hypothetical protein
MLKSGDLTCDVTESMYKLMMKIVSVVVCFAAALTCLRLSVCLSVFFSQINLLLTLVI